MLLHMLGYLTTLLEFLTRPLTRFNNPEEQRIAGIVASVTLILTPIVLVSALTVQSPGGILREIEEIRLGYIQITLILSMIYFAARTRWWRWGVQTGLGLMYLVILQQVIFQTGHSAMNLTDPLVWLVALVAACSLFMSLTYTLIITLVSLLLILILPLILPVIALADIHFSLFYVGAMSAFFGFLAFIRHRDQERLKVQRKALQNSEERYRTLFEASFEALVIHEAGMIRDCNPAFLTLLGYENPEEVIGRNVLTMTPPEEIENVKTNMAARRETYETRAIRKDGRVLDVQSRSKSIIYQNRPMRVVALIDITEQKKAAAEKMRQAIEQQRGAVLRQFVSDASHDLKTPLTVMATSVHLLRKTSQNPEKSARYLDKLNDQIRNMDKLLDDLFLMAKLDNPSYFAERMPVNLHMLAQDVIDGHRAAADQKELQMELAAEGPPTVIQGDERELHRALDRIVQNAIQYTPQGGKIDLRIIQNEHCVVVETRDTGIGIEPSDLELIFSRFYRSDQARQSGKGGMGLGLPIARKIVEGHGGRIEVESTPGTGSTFRVCLPLQSLV